MSETKQRRELEVEQHNNIRKAVKKRQTQEVAKRVSTTNRKKAIAGSDAKSVETWLLKMRVKDLHRFVRQCTDNALRKEFLIKYTKRTMLKTLLSTKHQSKLASYKKLYINKFGDSVDLHIDWDVLRRQTIAFTKTQMRQQFKVGQRVQLKGGDALHQHVYCDSFKEASDGKVEIVDMEYDTRECAIFFKRCWYSFKADNTLGAWYAPVFGSPLFCTIYPYASSKMKRFFNLWLTKGTKVNCFEFEDEDLLGKGTLEFMHFEGQVAMFKIVESSASVFPKPTHVEFSFPCTHVVPAFKHASFFFKSECKTFMLDFREWAFLYRDVMWTMLLILKKRTTMGSFTTHFMQQVAKYLC